MINPRWLKTFVTLIETGNFTRTAEKLFMTQPGVSQHISKLEKTCGYTLIKRGKKNFELTEQGRMVYHYANESAKNELALLEKLSFDDPYSGCCSLACSGALALTLYPKLLALQAKYPLLTIQLKAAPNHIILTEIQQGLIDYGLVTDVPNKKLFDALEVGQEELCLVLPKAVEIQGDIGNTLKNIGLIAHPDAEHYLSLYFLQSQEVSLHQLEFNDIPNAGAINQINQILQPVAKGLGFTVLPKSAVESFENKALITIFKPAKPVIEALYRVQKKGRELPKRYNTLHNFLQTMME
ncbi:LysR family transcriptional regulator [Colwellia sp. 1_MG-2023]|uniref:LysR family transcriptional regulator n=1 Tax=Colwellia sp. 1_MG-2023 TaxID=3062649 RepID=UPI0026E22DC1|nr:LysR family transcriptional regulator [Colwellia sp. 1_MG-2023]MDO6447488.1 LysR family transcriptional regulator [Colwellia sp. 1_MG-2023]